MEGTHPIQIIICLLRTAKRSRRAALDRKSNALFTKVYAQLRERDLKFFGVFEYKGQRGDLADS